MILALILAIAIGFSLALRGRDDLAPDPTTQCRWPICATTGLVVGGLTAMVLFGRFPLKAAIATSLVVIAVNSFAGLGGHLGQSPFDWRVGGMFLGATFLGMLSGRQFASRLAVEHLRRAFAWFVIAVACSS